jgi:hypothetical protein
MSIRLNPESIKEEEEQEEVALEVHYSPRAHVHPRRII